jgi:biopolymer transport protein TolR
MRVHRLLRRALRARRDEQPASGELNIVPFLDIVTNLMLFLLATTASVAAVSEVRADLPSFGPGRPGALGASVTVTERGVFVATAEGRLGAGCVPGGVGATVPRDAAGWDPAALTACMAQLHTRAPSEHTVVVSADPAVAYGELITAMDAVRADGDTPLFPDVQLSAGVR